MKKKSDKQVQGTNDSSILSKFSMTSLGYFDDPFVKEMVFKTVRRAPLINKGYYIRMKAVEFALNAFLQRFAGQRKHIVSLGAGFDTSFFRLKSRGQLDDCVFVEVDFLDVALNKARILVDREALSSLLRDDTASPLVIRDDNYVIVDTPGYKLLGVSLSQLDTLEACLRSVGVDEQTPTLFLAECVLSYVSEKRTSNLIWFLSQSYTNATFVLYEQMNPTDGFGKLMMSHFRKTGAPLLSLDKHPTKADQWTRFLKRGWRTAEVVDMNEFYFGLLSAEERRRVESLEVFDEHEEFHLLCGHYFLLIAQTNDPGLPPPASYIPGHEWSPSSPPQPAASSSPAAVCGAPLDTSADEAGWRVHAHVSVSLQDAAGERWICRVGGYGRNPVRGKGYSRLTSISLVREAGGEVEHVLPDDDELLDGGIFRSCSPVDGQTLLLFGGRVSPLCPSSALVQLRIWRHSDQWRAACSQLRPAGAGPSARWRHASCLLRHAGRTLMLLVGGRNSEGEILDDVFLYDVAANTWETCDRLPGGGRCSFRLTPLSDTECLLSCGLDADKLPSTSLLLFSLPHRAWRSIPVSGRLLPRFNHSAHLLRPPHLLLLCGGVGGHAHDSIAAPGVALLRLHDDAAAAEVLGEFPVNLSAVDEPAMLFDHDTVLAADGHSLVSVGGGGNCFSFGTHLNERLIRFDLAPVLQLV